MEVHGEHPVRAGGGEHVGHQLGGDGVSGLGLAVLTGVAEVGDHRRHPAGGGPLHGVNHDEQLHQIVVYRTAGGLDQEHVGTADRLIDGREHLSVGKMSDFRVAQLDADETADILGQTYVRVAAEHLHVFSV